MMPLLELLGLGFVLLLVVIGYGALKILNAGSSRQDHSRRLSPAEQEQLSIPELRIAGEG